MKARPRRRECCSSKRSLSASRIFAPAYQKCSQHISTTFDLSKTTTSRIILICARYFNVNSFVKVSSTITFTTGRFVNFFRRRRQRPPPPPRSPSPSTHLSPPQCNRHQQQQHKSPINKGIHDVVKRIHISMKDTFLFKVNQASKKKEEKISCEDASKVTSQITIAWGKKSWRCSRNTISLSTAWLLFFEVTEYKREICT